MDTQITRVSEWLADLRYQDIPDSVLNKAKLQILDILAAICAGSRCAAGSKIRKAVADTAFPGPCEALPDGESMSLHDAIYLQSALANALELDNLVFMGHVGQSTVNVPLILSQVLPVDSKTCLLAQVAAVEVAGRMGAYFAIGPQQGHMRSYLHRTAGAVAAAKMMGLNSETTARAIAIALSMPEFPLYPAAFSPETKVLCTSSPAVEGVRSAYLAAAGLDAAVDILEHQVGFWAYLSHLSSIPPVWAHVGETWSLHALSCKTLAACAYAQGPVAATLQLLEGRKLDPGSIDQVVVTAPITTIAMEAFSKPHLGAGVTPVNTHFSTKRSVAAALIFGKLDGNIFTPEVFDCHKNQIDELASRITLRSDWKMSIDLIRGIDDALFGAGKPGVFGMSQAQRTFSKFKEAFGSQHLFSFKEVPAILKLPSQDRSYLLKRIWRGYRVRWPFVNKAAQENYRSFEQDLSRFSFRQSGRVEVLLKNGRKLAGECRIPPGFAGDPSQQVQVEKKFLREATPVCGRAAAHEVMDMVMSLPAVSLPSILKKLHAKEK